MSIRAHVKRNARNALSGNYGRGFVMIALCIGLYMIFALAERLVFNLLQISLLVENQSSGWWSSGSVINYEPMAMTITGFAFLFYIILTASIFLGIKKWFYCICAENKTKINVIFDFFSSVSLFIKSLLLQLNVYIRCTGWGLLSFAPAFVLTGLITGIFNLGRSSIGMVELAMLLLCIVLYIIGALFTVLANSRYFLASYLWIENQSLGAAAACKKSVLLMKGRKTEIFLLSLSFIPLYLSNVFIFPMFITLPYMGVVRGIYAKNYIETGALPVFPVKEKN